MKSKDKTVVNDVGTISLKERVYITDPCYDISISVWCMWCLENVFPGKYRCLVETIDCGDWGNRVKELCVVKEDILEKYKDLNKIPFPKEPTFEGIGVDSGQCGIFDADYYEKNQPDNDYNNPNSWYRKICDLTNDTGTIDDLGVACASGYGDGTYPLYTLQEEDKVVAMKVVFIENDEILDS